MQEEKVGGSGSNPQTWKNENPFENIWTSRDEFLIVETMLKWEIEGKNPRADLGGVLASMRDKLDPKAATTATEQKLEEKLRRLKHKYYENIKYVRYDVYQPPKKKGLLPNLYHRMEQFFLGEVIRSREDEEEHRRKMRARADTASSSGNEDESFAATGKYIEKKTVSRPVGSC